MNLNLKKMEFNKGYDRADFYARTGMYFAEKKYRKEMPYLINTDDKEWRLFYDDDRLAGFYAREEKEDVTLVSGFFVAEDYRRMGVSEHMLSDAVEDCDRVRMVTCSQHLIKTLYSFHFERISSRGSYLTLEWKRENEMPL